MDIDAVTLLGSEFDNTGRYVMWSPLADLSSSENLTASQKLPFPTGVESKVKTTNSQDSFYATYDDYIRNLFETETETVERDGFQYEEEITDDKGRPILQLKAPTPENLELLAEFIEQINLTGFTFKGKLNSKGNWIPTDEAIAEWENNNYVLKDLGFKTVEDAYEAVEQIKDIINSHNLYIRTAPARTREQMAKNKCQYEMYLICSTASNLVELMVGLDVATSVLKDPKTGAVALSPYNGDDKHSAPGNYFTINQSCQEGQVGKDCVGIGAVSIKVNSTTQYYADKILWKGTAEDKQRLILPKVDEWGNRNDKKGDNCYVLGGVPRYGLYNLYDKNSENGTSNNSVEIIKLLDSIQTEDDITPNVALNLAAMLSVNKCGGLFNYRKILLIAKKSHALNLQPLMVQRLSRNRVHSSEWKWRSSLQSMILSNLYGDIKQFNKRNKCNEFIGI